MAEFALIHLNDGLFTIIDSEDFEKISKFKWHLSSHGYASNSSYLGGGRKKAKYKTTKMHRVILDVDDEKETHVDHINGNRLDNRKINLRTVNHSQNMRNRGINSNNKSGYKGVSWRKDLNKWKTTIFIDGKNVHLGFFYDKHEAARVYNEKALKTYGEYARLNVIKEECS